ncbi:MAG: ethanolamine ammonia-lyase subunit EutB, partial [Opitutaceae bacterium]
HVLRTDVTGPDLLRLSRGLSSEMIAACAKLMSNLDLMTAARKIRVVVHANNTLGESGRMGVRLQPNHPSDSIEGILASLKDGLSFGCGDAVIGINPVTDNWPMTQKILDVTHDFLQEWQVPTQNCCLAHVTTQMKARMFADFTPAATGRGLYASVDLEVGGSRVQESSMGVPPMDGATRRQTTGETPVPLRAGAIHAEPEARSLERGGFTFTLKPATAELRAGKAIDFAFGIVRVDGGAVALAPVMGAFAHLVAFDEARSGFAHLHPNEADLTKSPDPRHPVLTFKVTIPRAGNYSIWAQVDIGGREQFVPFRFAVTE